MIKSQPRRDLFSVVISAFVLMLSACGDAGPPREVAQELVIRECEGVAKTLLRDPDSARFDGWKSWEVTHFDTAPPVEYHPDKGDKLWAAAGQVNAKNGFGGYVGDQAYGCDAAITTDALVRAHAYSIDGLLTAPDDAPADSD